MTLRHQIVLALVAGVLLTAAGKSFGAEEAEATYSLGVVDDKPAVTFHDGVKLGCQDEAKGLSIKVEDGSVDISCVGPVHFHPDHFGSDFAPHGQ